jgi:STE24 endopeptidase
MGTPLNSTPILTVYLVLRLAQYSIETLLGWLNHRYAQNPKRQAEAGQVLEISPDAMAKSAAYARDKYRFGLLSNTLQLLVTLIFLAVGGLGWIEQTVSPWTGGADNPILTGLGFFALLGALGYILGLPFDVYFTFVFEQKHGFNRQTVKGFVSDQIKTILLSALLGAPLLAALLFVMGRTGSAWWIPAWLLLFGFSLLTAWLYPTLLAPLFNKFHPLEEGALRDDIYKLARKIAFNTDGISIMDASKRSSHGNAYFTGVFGKKKIVLFDTLVKSMGPAEVVAVLAHELGHFKLHHVRWSLIRSFFITGLMFFGLSLVLPLLSFYQAFGLPAVSDYGALVVFSLWFGPINFILQPLLSQISRRNEFQADAFALQNIDDKRKLGDALLKLRENSHLMPISHPWYSGVYHSHPPLLERLDAMGYLP